MFYRTRRPVSGVLHVTPRINGSRLLIDCPAHMARQLGGTVVFVSIIHSQGTCFPLPQAHCILMETIDTCRK